MPDQPGRPLRLSITAGNVIDLYHLPYSRADLERAAQREAALA